MRFFIIIPIFNVEKYLQKCLDSLRAQSFKNFHAILIDDGSSDKSAQIAQDFANQDSRFIFLQQKNQGVSIARNTALDFIEREFASAQKTHAGGGSAIILCLWIATIF